MPRVARSRTGSASAKHYLEKELDKQFQTNPDMWRFICEGSLDGLWYWDLEKPDNKWMNAEFWELLGIDPDTKSHRPEEWKNLIHPDDLKLALNNLNQHCADPAHPYDQIVRYTHADGSLVWVRCRGMAIRDKTGKPIRMLGAHNDVTALQVAKEQIELQQNEHTRILMREKASVEKVNSELRTFAYAASHDLKSPSNTAYMLLNELRDHSGIEFDEDGAELVDTAILTIDRMRTLVEELLTYTRVIGQDLVFEPIELNSILDAIKLELAAEIEEADAEITIGELPELEGHPLQIHLLLKNLISNALKFRRKDADCQISVSGGAAKLGSHIRLSVADNGIGIPEKNRKLVFEMFNRLHDQSEFQGTGLGLAMCHRIAINHGGNIRAMDAPSGPGSVFHVELREHW